MVHPAGLEPATIRSEVESSIQLSYGCDKNWMNEFLDGWINGFLDHAIIQ
jgi:hypothetical protein